MVKKNIGTADRIVRFFVAAVLGVPVILDFFNVMDFVDSRLLAIICAVVAFYLFLTALTDRCLIYKALDIDTHEHGGTYHSGEDVFDGRGGN